MISAKDNAFKAQVYNASELNDQATRLDAIACLKDMRLDRKTAHTLCDFLDIKEHPAVRTIAAQVLGYHFASVHWGEIRAEILRRSQKEADPLALRALVYALRDTDSVLSFFDHKREDVALEAVMGIPDLDVGLQALLEGIVRHDSDVVVRAMCMQLANFDDFTKSAVACLMAVSDLGGNFGERTLLLFKMVPQAPLLDALTDVSGEIERTYQTIWPGIWQREQQRRLLGLYVQSVAQHGASLALIDMLAERIGHDAEFYNQHLRFVRSLLAQLSFEDAQKLIVACQIVGKRAKRESLSRLSEVLVSLAGGVSGIACQVQETLGRWEHHLPGVRMKAFHVSR